MLEENSQGETVLGVRDPSERETESSSRVGFVPESQEEFIASDETKLKSERPPIVKWIFLAVGMTGIIGAGASVYFIHKRQSL